MLTERLERIWNNASADERERALSTARTTLANLVHYRPGKFGEEDVEQIAADIVAFSKEQQRVERSAHVVTFTMTVRCEVAPDADIQAIVQCDAGFAASAIHSDLVSYQIVSITAKP